MAWNDKKQVKKGNIAEDQVEKYLEGLGYVIYRPVTPGAHPFDRLAVKDKKEFFIVEVKGKAAMNKYRATGFDVRSYNTYKECENKLNIPVKVFFVDENSCEIYGNYLAELERESQTDAKYPNTDISPGKIIFSLENMVTYTTITEDVADKMKQFNSRNYNYT